ncbi:hypothetical protein IV454_06695 [Massilia antarctica]|uniref:Uncharacterized protein n=1 Tax=Massilia antarctica TaxID=2765360 RepID=A0AA48WEM3_9BURK|nr:hypothetical protein [Massilia antarctica]QPI51210.1 hypothetical protein IV454_06695 [Massilia antarctica]
MTLRSVLFVGLATVHAVIGWIWAGTGTLGPAIAATIYGPLFVLDALGLPVFGSGASGGWAAPSLLGWVCVVLVWAAIWWGAAALLARLRRR